MEEMCNKCESYLDIVDFLGIEKGDLIYLSSGLLKIMWLCRNTREEFDANMLLNRIQDKLGPDGTLLIPTYNFDFSNQGYYDIRNSQSVVGYLGNVALGRKDFQRTKHPIHSFAVWGKDKEILCNLNNKDSFGEDSPFAYLLEHNGKEIGIGVDYTEGFTFIHYVEVKAKIPYRFYKTFQGIYVDEDGIKKNYECIYPARDRSVQCTLNKDGLTSVLEENGAGKRYVINDINCFSLNLKQCYPTLLKELTHNHAKRVFEFSKDIYSDTYKVFKD